MRSLDDPAACRMSLLSCGEFTGVSTLVRDVRDVTASFGLLPTFGIVIAFVFTQMLQALGRGTRAWHHNAIQHRRVRFHIGHVGTRHHSRQGYPAPIHQLMAFAAQFGAVGRIRSRVCAAQRGGNGLGVYRLPRPRDPVATIIPLQHQTPESFEDTAGAPLLEAPMNCAT